MSGHFIKFIIACCFMASLSINFIKEPVLAADTESSISAILVEMKDRDAKIRKEAIGKLAQINLDEQPVNTRDEAIEGLKNLLKDPEKSVRYEAAYQLPTTNPLCQESVPVLTDAFKEGGKYAMIYMTALGRCGRDAESAVPAIIEAMKKPSADNSWEYYCAYTLEEIGTPEALEAIKPFKQKQARRLKLISPMKSPMITFLITCGFLGLFWWCRSRRKKGERIIAWPLLIVAALWGISSYDAYWVNTHPGPVITLFNADWYWSIALLVSTIAGLVPWVLSLLWRKKHAAPAAPAS